ncbi:hypothetical protein K3495_g7933 [Podosphaera aphanis]|nr:hypothetical protein K3495_g7933 [Podosphaera aphanis]
MTDKGTPWKWGSEQHDAFEFLKRKFISEPALAQWDPDRDTMLEADYFGYSNVNFQQAEGADIFVNEDLQSLWNQAVREDTKYAQIISAVQTNLRSWPKDLKVQPEGSDEAKPLKVTIASAELKQDRGLLCYQGRIWVPMNEPLTTALIQNIHDAATSGHPGRDAALAQVAQDYFWPGISKAVKRFCKNCHVCGRSSIWRHQKQGLLQLLPTPDRYHQELSIDFMVDLPESDGATNIMVITDRLLKSVTLEAMEKMDAESCAEKFLDCHWRFHGFPRAITSDRGTNWTSKFWKRLCELVGIEQRLSTAYHPQTDGATERANQEVQTSLRVYVTYTQHDWSKRLPAAQIAINNRDVMSLGGVLLLARIKVELLEDMQVYMQVKILFPWSKHRERGRRESLKIR